MPTPLFECRVADRSIRVVATDRNDGDIHPERVCADELFARQVRATGGRWTMLDEVHGVTVVEIDHTVDVGQLDQRPTVGTGDVIVSDRFDVHLAVWTADCAPLVLIAEDGRVVGAHGGWRGLADGVIDVAVDAARDNGAAVVAAVLGPSIGPCCYAFGRDDLAAVAQGVHAGESDVAGISTEGERALDVPAAVRAGLDHHGIALDVVGPCTGCDDRWFSNRIRSDPGRHATVVVIGS